MSEDKMLQKVEELENAFINMVKLHAKIEERFQFVEKQLALYNARFERLETTLYGEKKDE